jgi:hypothetical protein
MSLTGILMILILLFFIAAFVSFVTDNNTSGMLCIFIIVGLMVAITTTIDYSINVEAQKALVQINSGTYNTDSYLGKIKELSEDTVTVGTDICRVHKDFYSIDNFELKDVYIGEVIEMKCVKGFLLSVRKVE